ncbi:hypothetical protein F5Y10DRAFT_99717 [Nemania abortiva]|nr:hypothetical protein F5Y10DRAFT_99717 [Nemania abortiva]
MGIDKTAEWGDKLAELVVREVVTPPPAENAVNARLTGIDGTGIAALVSKLEQDAKAYDGFALVFQNAKDYQSFEWLQFITRQLVVNNISKKGNLIFATNTTSYQLVESAAEIIDYTFASGSKPANWDTCWKVDSTIVPNPKPFFREAYEYAISPEKKLTAILDAPSVMTGKNPADNMKQYYEDIPGNLVVMKDALGSNEGISRAYFSDYLVKKVITKDGEKWQIFARFDFNLTWNPVTKDTNRKDFTLHSLKTTATTELLECHKTALLHKTTKNIQPWESFRNSIPS